MYITIIPVCFADYTRVSYLINTKHNVVKLQDNLKNVISWSEKYNLALHLDKFEYVCH